MAGASKPASMQKDVLDYLQEQDESNRKSREAFEAQRDALLVEHESKRLRDKWRNCLAAGLAVGIALACFFGFAGTFSTDPAVAIPVFALVAFAGGFLFPFGFTVIKEALVDKGVSNAIIWLVVVFFYPVVFPLCSLIGIPGIVLIRNKAAAARTTIGN